VCVNCEASFKDLLALKRGLLNIISFLFLRSFYDGVLHMFIIKK
jgi:hypothetical protein